METPPLLGWHQQNFVIGSSGHEGEEFLDARSCHIRERNNKRKTCH